MTSPLRALAAGCAAALLVHPLAARAAEATTAAIVGTVVDDRGAVAGARVTAAAPSDAAP